MRIWSAHGLKDNKKCLFKDYCFEVFLEDVESFNHNSFIAVSRIFDAIRLVNIDNQNNCEFKII